MPLANSFLAEADLSGEEPAYPLRVYVCGECLLVQAQQFVSPAEIFGNYAYFSSYSRSWLEHARAFARNAVSRFALGPESLVIEVGSNDGYLLQYFKRKGVAVHGIEPALNVAGVARRRGIPTTSRFFGMETAGEMAIDGMRADLLVCNNVMAHTPDLNDFVGGLKVLLHSKGVVTIEFPHLLRLMEGCQFDTIYHEHFSYFTLRTVRSVLRAHGLEVIDVEELPTHGGSLRVYVQHSGRSDRQRVERIKDLMERENAAGLDRLEGYLSFEARVDNVKRSLIQFFDWAKKKGKKTVVGYGAPAKGNTLLNYCGIGTDLLEYTVDRNPHKQGCYLPGTHIPVKEPEKVRQTRPHFLLILPWNLADEIVEQMSFIREWGGRFVVPLPTVRVLE
jgi:SAM-dependent methyltransferase